MRVTGESMAPSLQDGALVCVSTRAYRRRAPRRGEIVAARPGPLGGKALIKRLIGLPGDQVNAGGMSRQLKHQEYYLLGDAQEDSLDSRKLGPVTRGELIGPVLFNKER